MKKLFFFFGLFLFTGLHVFSQSDKVLGYWLTEKGTSQIKIFKATNGKYYGEVSWLKEDPEKKDIHNPDEKLRDVKLLGLRILKSFNYEESKKQWNEGTIYDPDNGKTYDCYMWFEDDINVLKIKGYVLGMKFLGRETTWTREDPRN
ncbi:MAG: DUF2147 domain-containing protein [Bacteroidales bacterium]|nr:DUF2147 domain-containing protein [Bacteroidales bacterium]